MPSFRSAAHRPQIRGTLTIIAATFFSRTARRSRPMANSTPRGTPTAQCSILSGKDSPKYTPFMDCGDHVIVINADKVRITGLKADNKVYYHYSGFPGGIKAEEY